MHEYRNGWEYPSGVPSGSLLVFGKKALGPFSSYTLDNPDLYYDVITDIAAGGGF